MRICRATRAQASDCAAIYNYWVKHSSASFDTEGRDAARTEAWHVQHQPDRYPLLVAVDADETVVGWGSLTPWSSRSGYRHTAEISLFTHADHLRRGIAREIGHALLEHARAHSLRVLLARLEAGNEPSRRLFAQLGFREVGTMHAVGHKFGRWLDVLLLEYDLRPPGDDAGATPVAL